MSEGSKIEESPKEAKRYNLNGLINEKKPHVERTIASAPLVQKSLVVAEERTQNSSPEAKGTARRLICEAWDSAAAEVSRNNACLSVLSMAVGIACGVSASFNAHLPAVAATGIVAFVICTAISKHTFGRSIYLSQSQRDSSNLYHIDPDAWQDEGVYKRAERKIGQMVLALQNLGPSP